MGSTLDDIAFGEPELCRFKDVDLLVSFSWQRLCYWQLDEQLFLIELLWLTYLEVVVFWGDIVAT